MKSGPITGEIAAIKGYGFQYIIFATEIYNALLYADSLVEWVEFASNKAGKLDDVLIGLSDSILAFQIKNIVTTNFTYNNLVESETQSILEGMFVGWKKLRVDNPDKKIDVRFITTQSVSNNDKILSFGGDKKPSFQYFLDHLWIAISTDRYNINSIPDVWAEIFEDLMMVTKASSRKEIIDFIKDTKFVFDYSIPKYFDKYIERQREIDIENIAKHIFRIVGKKGSIRYNKKEFLEEFGLARRYESYYTHSFFVDEEHYESIDGTLNEIENHLMSYNNGYIALIGNAGSGKSTLLTKWLQRSSYRILRYYTYVNVDMNYEFGFRGEAKSFLHDLLVQIRQSSYALQERLPTLDLIDLQKHFNEELNKLSEGEEKVIIIVDGLDHIEREQDVSRSLLSVLPKPDNIPKNIYFILGSRRIENLDELSSSIKINISSEKRVVKINPLSKEKVHKILSSYQITLSQELFEELYQNTQGHPLFLRYTIEAIRNGKPEEIEDVISQKIFTGNIDNEYKIFWDKNKDQDDFIEVLGLMARFRHSYFDIHLLDSFEKITRANMIKINKLSEDYFYKTGNIWQFFHSSFKEFLIMETAKNLFTEEFNIDLDRQYHVKIYEATKKMKNSYMWNEIYHLHKAKKYSSIITIVSQGYFRKQWFEYRNYKLIKEDIQLAIDSSNKIDDIYCLFKCFLSLFELKQRHSNFDPRDHVTTFHKLGYVAIANSFIYNNVELLVPAAQALDYCITLFKQGYIQLAFDVFSRATPTYILDHEKKTIPRRNQIKHFQETDEVQLVCKWAKAASLFTPLDEIFHTIGGLTSTEQYGHEKKGNLFAEVFSEVLDISIEFKNWDNLKTLENILDKKSEAYDQFYYYYNIVEQLPDENPYYAHCANKLVNFEITENNSINRRLLKVYLFWKKDKEKAKQVFNKVLAPHKINRPTASLDETSFLHYIFDYSSFLYIVSKDFTIPIITFLPQESKQTKNAFFKAFAELGKSYAYIYHNHKDAAIDYYFQFDQILQLFHYNHTEYEYEYLISTNKSTLINLVLKISLKLSKKILDEILLRLDNEWDNQKRFWNVRDKQKIIEEVIDLIGKNSWIYKQLEKIDTYAFNSGYLNERIEEAVIQINLWAKVGNTDKGISLLNHIMKISFDVRGEKDNQLDYLVQWMEIAKISSAEEIEFYLERVNSLNSKVNSRSHTPSLELLRLSLYFNNGFEVFKYLLFKGLITFTDGLEVILSYLISTQSPDRKLIIKIFSKVLIAYDDNHHERQYFLEEVFKLDLKLSITELKELVKEIKIYAISEYTNDYLYRVQEYATVNNIDSTLIGIDIPILKRERQSNSELSEIKLKDGSKISSSDLFDKINNLDELQDIRDQSHYYGSFDWSRIYQKVFNKSNENDILEFSQRQKFKSLELAEVAEALINLNKYSTAKKLLYLAISKGEKYGWVNFIDGGSKIVPFELLYKIEDANTFNRAAFNDFSDSVGSLDTQSYELLLKDTKIWNLLSTNLDLTVMYKEIREFRNELLKTHTIDTSSPSVKGILNTNGLLLETIHFLITFPSDFGYGLSTALVEEYNISTNIIRQVLKNLFKQKFYTKYIQLLSVINLKDTSITIENKENLIYLLNSNRYDISHIAYQILKCINVNPELLLIKSAKELPFVYSLDFKYTPSFFSSEEIELKHIDKKGFLKDTEDPLVYIKLYRTQVNHLSDHTKIPVINIAYRIMTLGTNEEFPDWCNSISEEEIRRIYDSKFDLRISYIRPRYRTVWDGMMKVIKELWELNRIDTSTADMLSDEFDAYAYLIEPKPRPPFVNSILEENSGRAPSAKRGWGKELTDEYLSKVLSFSTEDNSFILAEHSILQGMGWGHTLEVRQSFIDFNNIVHWGEHRSLIYNFTSKDTIQDYLELEDDGVTLYNGLLTINKKRNWLAINPLLCQGLDLVFNPNEGNFRWDDKQGNKTIESIYWQTHSTDNSSKHHNSESGYGWYVIMYKRGYEMFKKFVVDNRGSSTVFHHRKVSRHLDYIQEQYQTDIKEDFSKTKSEKILL